MTERPAWLINRTADLILQGVRDQAELTRLCAAVQTMADNSQTPPRVRDALLRALTEGTSE